MASKRNRQGNLRPTTPSPATPRAASNPSTPDTPTSGIETALHRPAAAVLREDERLADVMSAYQGIFARSFAFAPYHADSLIATKGYDHFDRLLECAAYYSPFRVLKSAILYKDWSVKPFLKDASKCSQSDYDLSQKMADELEWHLQNIVDEGDLMQDFREVIEEILHPSCHIGFGVTEIGWRLVEDGPSGGPQHGFRRFAAKEPKQVGFRVDPVTLAPRYLTSYSPLGPLRDVSAVLDGNGSTQYQIPLEKVLYMKFGSEKGLPYGRGLARAAYKHWWVLDNLERIHAIALEVHGAPNAVLKGPFGSQEIANEMLAKLQAMRMSGAICVPEGYELELLQLGAGAMQVFTEAKRWHAEQIAQTVLLNQLTMNQGQGQGSYALGAIHQNTQSFGLKDIRRRVENLFRAQLFRRWARYNYGPKVEWMAPVLDLGEWDADEQKLVAEFFNTLVTSGVVHPQEPQIRDRLRLAPPSAETAAIFKKREELDMKAQEVQTQVRVRQPSE